MTAQRSRQQRWEEFLSLEWYEITLRFIATFVAKTSELLLAAGLVVSSANFLTDGNVLQAGEAAHAWAWAQALAIDSSLAISFYYVLQCLRQRDWIKLALYSLLTLMLALVAGTITNIDIYSHAVHATIQQATGQLGIDVELLSTLRAVAVVGFVLMSRLRDVSFKDLYQPGQDERQQPAPAEQDIDHRLTVEEVARLLHIVASAAPRITQEEFKASVQEQSKPLASLPPQTDAAIARLPEPAPLRAADAAEQLPSSSTSTDEKHALHETVEDPMRKRKAKRAASQTDGEQQHDIAPEQDEQLEQAYKELQAQGKRVSGRALAQIVHIHRSTCNAWLEERKREQSQTGQEPSEQQKNIEETNPGKEENENA